MRKILTIGVTLGIAFGVFLAATSPALAGGNKVGSGGMTFQITLPEGASPTAPAAIPPNCSNWHEIWPNYCVARHQDSYQDNADNVISACDIVTLAGQQYHIDWVGPTYFFDCVGITGTFSVAFEPSQAPHNPSNPVCENWHVVYAAPGSGLAYCNIVHIDTWQDLDNSGALSNGDRITISGTVYILRSIGIDIITTGVKNADIPTLNEWGVLALALLVMGLGLFILGRRARTNAA